MGISLQPQASVATAYNSEGVNFGILAGNDANARVFRPIAGQGLKLTKVAIPSQEVRADLQGQRDRHGPRSVTGTLGGELSLGTFDALVEAVMRSTWTTVLTPAAFNITSYSSTTGILTRAAGSFLSDGFRVGDTVFLGAAGLNNGRPGQVVAVGTTTLTIGNRTSWVDMGSVSNATLTRPKKLILGTTRRSFSFEHWAASIANSERFLGVRVTSMTISMPAAGPVTIEFGFTGWDMVTGTTQHFTSAVSTTSLQMVSSQAAVCVGGVQSATVQSATITVDLQHSTPQVAGSNTSPDVVEGQAQVTGSVTLFVRSQAELTAFINETQVPLSLLFREADTNGFFSVALSNVTYGDYTTERIGQNDAQLATVPLMVGIASGADRDASMLTIVTSAA